MRIQSIGSNNKNNAPKSPSFQMKFVDPWGIDAPPVVNKYLFGGIRADDLDKALENIRKKIPNRNTFLRVTTSIEGDTLALVKETGKGEKTLNSLHIAKADPKKPESFLNNLIDAMANIAK